MELSIKQIKRLAEFSGLGIDYEMLNREDECFLDSMITLHPNDEDEIFVYFSDYPGEGAMPLN